VFHNIFYDLSCFLVRCKLLGLGAAGFEKETLKYLIFQDRFDMLLEMKFSSVAEQGYTMSSGKSQTKEQHNGKECQTRNKE